VEDQFLFHPQAAEAADIMQTIMVAQVVQAEEAAEQEV
jgi:hypothetical protein